MTWFDDKARYGFIETADWPAVFVHLRAVSEPGVQTLEVGQRVLFDLIDDLGPRAANVCLVNPSYGMDQDPEESYPAHTSQQLGWHVAHGMPTVRERAAGWSRHRRHDLRPSADCGRHR